MSRRSPRGSEKMSANEQIRDAREGVFRERFAFA
jgi:hypothetical protein